MTSLPIHYPDWNWKTIKAKYIDEETPMLARWMAFGWYIEGLDPAERDAKEMTKPGYLIRNATHVDIHETNTGDIFTHVPVAIAERILKARDEFCTAILGILTDQQNLSPGVTRYRPGDEVEVAVPTQDGMIWLSGHVCIVEPQAVGVTYPTGRQQMIENHKDRIRHKGTA